MDIKELSRLSGASITRIRTLLRGNRFPDDCIALRPGKGKAVVFTEMAVTFIRGGSTTPTQHKLPTQVKAVISTQPAQALDDMRLKVIEQKLDRIEHNQALIIALLQAQTGGGMAVLIQAVDKDKLMELLTNK